VASAVEDSEQLMRDMMQDENYRIGVKAMHAKSKPDWKV
jgi:hypothetical protein